MTVSTTTTRTVLIANGAQTVWTFDFYAPSDDVIQLIVVDIASGVGVPISTNFTVLTRTATGGTLRYPNTGPALPTGNKLVILRSIPHTQPTDIINQGGFYPEALEGALDWLEMQIQQDQTDKDRSLKLRPYDVDGSGVYDAHGNSIAGVGTTTDPTGVVTAAQVSQMIATALAGLSGGGGSVIPIPLAGQAGYPLQANALSGWGWGTDKAKFRIWASPTVGRVCRLEDYGMVSTQNSSLIATSGAAFNAANAANNVAAFNAVMASATTDDEFILPAGYTPMNAGVTLANLTTLRGRPTALGSHLVLTADISGGTPFLNCNLTTRIEDILFWVADGLTTGTAIACGHIATGGNPAMEDSKWRNLRASHFNTGAWYAGFAILAENGPANYGSRSVVIDTIHAGAYKYYGMGFAGCNALRGTNLFFVQNLGTPVVADLYMYGQASPINNSNNLCYLSGGGFGNVRIGRGGNNVIHCSNMNDLSFDTGSATNLITTTIASGTVADFGTNNTVLMTTGRYHSNVFTAW
jgi:hypothetical protein